MKKPTKKIKPTDIASIRALAAAAGGGEWFKESGGRANDVWERTATKNFAHSRNVTAYMGVKNIGREPRHEFGMTPETAAFIIACSPRAALRMCDEIEFLRTSVEFMESELGNAK